MPDEPIINFRQQIRTLYLNVAPPAPTPDTRNPSRRAANAIAHQPP